MTIGSEIEHRAMDDLVIYNKSLSLNHPTPTYALQLHPASQRHFSCGPYAPQVGVPAGSGAAPAVDSAEDVAPAAPFGAPAYDAAGAS